MVGSRIDWIQEKGNCGGLWYQFVQQLYSFRLYRGAQPRYARNVTARVIDAGDEPILDRIAAGLKYDRDR